MRRAAFTGLGFLFFALLTAAPAAAQTPDAPQAPALTREQVTSYARAYIAVSAARDAVHLEMAQARNKTPEAQRQLQEKLREQIAKLLEEHALTEVEYRRLTTIISSDPAQRRVFDEIIAELTKKT